MDSKALVMLMLLDVAEVVAIVGDHLRSKILVAAEAAGAGRPAVMTD